MCAGSRSFLTVVQQVPTDHVYVIGRARRSDATLTNGAAYLIALDNRFPSHQSSRKENFMPAPRTRYSLARERLIIRGTDAGAFMIAAFWVVICFLLAGWSQLPWPALAFMFIGGTTLFLLIGWFQRSKTIAVFPDHLRLTAWLEHRRIPLETLVAFSLRSTMEGRSLRQTIICWDQDGQELGEIPTAPFRKDDLAQLLSVVQSDHPTVTLDRELEHFLRT
jgi:hypothetical protein